MVRNMMDIMHIEEIKKSIVDFLAPSLQRIPRIARIDDDHKNGLPDSKPSWTPPHRSLENVIRYYSISARLIQNATHFLSN